MFFLVLKFPGGENQDGRVEGWKIHQNPLWREPFSRNTHSTLAGDFRHLKGQDTCVDPFSTPQSLPPFPSFGRQTRDTLRILGDRKRKIVFSRLLKQTISSKPFHKSHPRICQQIHIANNNNNCVL